MNCLKCKHENAADARFCEECGAKFGIECPSCAAENAATAKFCRSCGVALAETASPSEPPHRAYTPKHLADKILQTRSALEGERKQVTVMFADVKGSMELAEQLDAEDWHRILDRFFEILAKGVHRFEGTVNQYTGDGIMALFGAPIAHEDHAQRACYAVLWLRDQLQTYTREMKREHGVGISTRIGLNSGAVVVGAIGDDLRMDYTAQGHTVGLAQRMESLAEPNECYLSDATARIVSGYFELEDLGPFQVKGVSDPVNVFQLQGTGSMQSRFDLSRARGLSRFVGREREMATLEAALDQAKTGKGQIVGIVADAGTGKSRLTFEFIERCRSRGYEVYGASCPSHGKSTPLSMGFRVQRNAFGITEQDSPEAARDKIAARVARMDASLVEFIPMLMEFLDVAEPGQPQLYSDPDDRKEAFTQYMKASVAIHKGGVRVVYFEDMHWCDRASQLAMFEIARLYQDGPYLLVSNFRPEYRPLEADWPNYEEIRLKTLGPESTAELLQDLMGPDASGQGLETRIQERAAGNPFFVEEIVQSLAESGCLEGNRGAYRLAGAVESISVPDRVQSVLAARIDRLEDDTKRLLQTASVIGKDFPLTLLQRVVEQPPQELEAQLYELSQAEFVYQEAVYPEIEYAFKHPLTQQVAYDTQLRDLRRKVHASVAKILEVHRKDKLGEAAALIAHHWTEAGENDNAARWHAKAADWAGVNDVQAALSHWRKVRELTSGSNANTETADLALTACSQFLSLGWRVDAPTEELERTFNEGVTLAKSQGALPALASLNANYSAIRGLNEGIARDYVRYAEEAVRIADQTDDPDLRCGARGYLLYANFHAGQVAPHAAVGEEIIEIAKGDYDLGASVSGFSQFLAATQACLYCQAVSIDPRPLFSQLDSLRESTITHDYKEMYAWFLAIESLVVYAVGDKERAALHAREARQFVDDKNFTAQTLAHLSTWNALIFDERWDALLEESTLFVRGANKNTVHVPRALFHLALAHLKLGRPELAFETAEEAVRMIEENDTGFAPNAYAVLASSQIVLGEPASAIKQTLDRYEARLERCGLRIYLAEVFELRARLAKRESDSQAQANALQRTRALYTEFGAAGQLKRLAREFGEPLH